MSTLSDFKLTHYLNVAKFQTDKLPGDEMLVSHGNDLKQALFNAFDGFGDKRIKKLSSGDYFIIDERGAGDRDARGNLFLWFCQIGVSVVDRDKVKLSLRGGVPQSADVKKWAKSMGAAEDENSLEVLISAGQQNEIKELANAFRAITKPGARSSVSAYKYVCPRTAKSLDKLAEVLGAAWKISR